MPHLVAIFGPKRGVNLELHDGFVVGRSSAADLQLVDAKVSREHCRFALPPEGGRIEDLGSHNGTYVNGVRLTGPAELHAGDEIAVGDSLLIFDGELDVLSSRFGDSTIVLGAHEEAAAPGKVRTAEGPPPATRPRALAEALAGSDDAETAAEALLHAMETAFAPQRAYVLLHDEGHGPRPLILGKHDGALAVSRTALELAARRGEAIALEDAAVERALQGSRSVARHRLRTLMAAPVTVAGRTGGFLCCDRDGPPWTDADAALLDAYAAVASAHGLYGAFRAPVIAAAGSGDGPVGRSAVFRRALRVAETAAAAPSTVLLTGESGTGKEEVARFIHARSPRARGPFVVVNCGAIPEQIAESQLFGHERGAFTGAVSTQQGLVEAADGGTLFLDEIGELPPPLQVKLLRVLQERSVMRIGAQVVRRIDLRVVAATNRDLEADVRSGRFREDLFYRLNVIRIELPPLRDRREDVPELAAALLGRIATALGRRDPGLDREAGQRLARLPWPGNVRELQNVLERTLVLREPGETGPLGAAELEIALPAMPTPPASDAPPNASLADKIVALERTEIAAALRTARGVKARAAAALGISRPTLDKKIADLGIGVSRLDEDAAQGGE